MAGVANDVQCLLRVGGGAVSVGVLDGDLTGNTGEGAAEITGKAAHIALRGGTGDCHLSRAHSGVRIADAAGEGAGTVRTSDRA